MADRNSVADRRLLDLGIQLPAAPTPFGAYVGKTSVRLVIGVASVPLGIPVELDVIFEVAE